MINKTYSLIRYVGDGQTLQYNFDFDVAERFGAGQIEVFIKNIAAKTITRLIKGEDYIVNFSLRFITLGNAYNDNYEIIIARNLAPIQDYNFANLGLSRKEQIEAALDYRAMLEQQIKDGAPQLFVGVDFADLRQEFDDAIAAKITAQAAAGAAESSAAEAVDAAQASEDAAAESGTYADSAASASSAAATSAANAASSETAAQEAAQEAQEAAAQAWQQAEAALSASKLEVSGVITTSGGSPIENQEVILKSNGLTYTVYTAADGSYIIKNLPKGIDIVISAPNSNEGIIHIANPQDNIIQNFTVPQKIALKDLPVGFDFSGKTIYLPADFVPSVFSWQPNSLDASISISRDGSSGMGYWSIGKTFNSRWGIKSGATSELLVMAQIDTSEQTITILATQFTFDNEHEYILANNYAGQDDATLSREFLAAAYVLE